MNPAEMVTDFKLRNGNRPVKVGTLMKALNAYLGSLKLQPDGFGFRSTPWAKRKQRKNAKHQPVTYRWLIAFAVENDSEGEGYFIHVAAIDYVNEQFIDVGIAKNMSAGRTYEITREAQRFLSAARRN